MRRQQHLRKRPASNGLERQIQAVANLPEGYKLLLLPFLPAWLAPASWNLWGFAAGTFGLLICVAVALYSIRRNERTLAALLYEGDERSVTTIFFSHLLMGLGLSIALFLPLFLLPGY